MTPSDEDCTRLAPEWLNGVARGGRDAEAAAHRLFKCFYRRMVNYLASVFHFDEFTAEEVAQTAMINGMKAAGTFRGNSKVYTWFVRIAINAAKDHIDKENRRVDRPVASAQDPLASLPGDTDPPDESAGLKDSYKPDSTEPVARVDASEEREAFQACIDRQFALFCKDNPECGEAIRRFYFDGWSSKDLAAARGKSDDAMRTELKTCRQRLRTYFAACQELPGG